MAKHKTKEEWIALFKRYEKTHKIPKTYFEDMDFKECQESKAKHAYVRTSNYKIGQGRQRFFIKYKKWKILDNMFMSKKQEIKRKIPKRDIDGFVKKLTREQLEEIARKHIKQNEKNKDKTARYSHFSKTEMAFILNVHRTTLYKKKKPRVYKLDEFKKEICTTFSENKGIYGRRKMKIILKQKGISVNARTLGRCLNRWGLITKTRVAKRKSESKNTNVYCMDLVKRNYNPKEDNILATDVSYIPANTEGNHVYLSVVISHKTKLIESWKLSKNNDTQLVMDTLTNLKRKHFILHSDHGSQYSTFQVQNWLKNINSQTSMSRIGNSLDNREVEYFFGCLKGEYLNHIRTHTMSIDEIKKHISWYIDWYNTKRIQKRLQWKTPASASAYAI